MGKSCYLLAPCEVLQDALQEGDAKDDGNFGKGRSMGAKRCQPAQNVRMALKLIELEDLRMTGGEITEEAAKGPLVDPSGAIAEGGGKRLRGTCKQ